MAHIYVSAVIDAPIEDVWAIARDYTGHWHSSVICNSSIEGGLPSDQIGCVRAFELCDGGKLREVLVGMSDEDHEFSYRILDSPLPVEDYFAAVRFAPVTTTGHDVRRVDRRLPRADPTRRTPRSPPSPVSSRMAFPTSPPCSSARMRASERQRTSD